MIQISRAKRYSLVILVIVFTLLTMYTSVQDIFAANNLSPLQVRGNPSSLWHTVSNGNTSGRGSNLLYAPRVVLKAYSRSAAPTFTFINGGQCGPGHDSNGGVGARITTFRIRGTYANEAQKMGSGAVVETNNSGNCTRNNISLSTTSGLSETSNIPGRSGYKAYYISVTLGSTNPSHPVNGTERNGFLNSFQVRISDGIVSSAETVSGDAFRSGMPSDHAISLLGRPSSNAKNSYEIEFKAPCTLPAGRTRMFIKWFDADYGTTYQSNDIAFSLRRRVTTGGEVNVATVSRHGVTGDGNISPVRPGIDSFLGGEAEFRQLDVPVVAGVEYVWRWSNVTNRNGVQFWMPFDGTGVEFDCPSSPSVDARCEILSLPSRAQPGDSIPVRLRVTNTGTLSWNQSRFVLGASSGNSFNETGVATPDNLRFLPSSGLAAGASHIFEFNVLAPDTLGDNSFRWGMLDRDRPSNMQEFGNRCARTINIYQNRNYPYVRGTTNDIWSGAVFDTDTDACGVTSDARISTNTLNSADILEGARPGFEEALIFVSRMYSIVRGAAYTPGPADRAGINYWIGRYLDDDRYNEEAIIRQFLTAEGVYREADESNEAFVRRLYNRLYGRSNIGDEEMDYWLSSGQSRESMTFFFIRQTDGWRAPFGLRQNFYNYGGSGSDYGVFSTGINNIQPGGLGGMVGSNGSSHYEVFDLTFANTDDVGVVDYEYGNYRDTPLCLPDFYEDYEDEVDSDLRTAFGLMNADGDGDGVVAMRTGNASIGSSSAGITVPNGPTRVWLVDGNVTINNDITYEAGSLTNRPGFILIAKGNITIHNRVSRLDGIYIAQPSDTADGMISTCNSTANQRAGDHGCSQRQLKVNGSLVAQRIRLLRTYGSLGATSYGETGNLVDEQCSALQGFLGNYSVTTRRLYSTQGSSIGTVNQCAAEWVDAHPERYFMRQTGGGSDDTQSFRELPPIF